MLQQHRSQHEPDRLVDTLIIGAFIEARSCERFAAIAPYLDTNLQQFYQKLLSSEARHFEVYLHFAKSYAANNITDRIEFFRHIEIKAIKTSDDLFRFHSGIPKKTDFVN